MTTLKRFLWKINPFKFRSPHTSTSYFEPGKRNMIINMQSKSSRGSNYNKLIELQPPRKSIFNRLIGK